MPTKSRSRKRIDKRILEHELVPEHRVLSFREAIEVLKRLQVKPNQLPRISINDPVVRLLHAKPACHPGLYLARCVSATPRPRL